MFHLQYDKVKNINHVFLQFLYHVDKVDKKRILGALYEAIIQYHEYQDIFKYQIPNQEIKWFKFIVKGNGHNTLEEQMYAVFTDITSEMNASEQMKSVHGMFESALNTAFVSILEYFPKQKRIHNIMTRGVDREYYENVPQCFFDEDRVFETCKKDVFEL